MCLEPLTSSDEWVGGGTSSPYGSYSLGKTVHDQIVISIRGAEPSMEIGKIEIKPVI
jgi:hypothetical protein